MKKPMLCLVAIFLFGTAFTFASEMDTRKPIPFTASVIKSLTDPLGYKGLSVSVDFMLKDTNFQVVYSETHETTLNNLAEFKINIGQGINQVPLFDQADLGAIEFYCYTITVHDPGGDVVMMNSDLLGSSSSSINSETAQNADALDQNYFINSDFYLQDLNILNSDNVNTLINVVRQGPNADLNYIRPYNLHNFISINEVPSAAHIDTLLACVGLGLGHPLPIVFAKQPVDKLENYFTLCPQDPENFYNGFGVKMPNTGTPNTHSTAAIYGENIHDAQGVGIYAKGLSRGVYAQGVTGVIGIYSPQPGSNGASIWGYPGAAPGTGDFTYGGLFQDNDLANTTALGVFGGGFTTKAFTTPSDRRLKRDIRTSALGLDIIMQLRPKQYEYIDNTPYSFPEGVQEGFIAQELEEVLPNLVTDLVFPKSLDADSMSTSGTETYKGINYTGLIPVLTKALQELNAKVDAQSAEIKRLNEELEALKQK